MTPWGVGAGARFGGEGIPFLVFPPRKKGAPRPFMEGGSGDRGLSGSRPGAVEVRGDSVLHMLFRWLGRFL